MYLYYQSLVSNTNYETIALSIGGDNYCYEGFPAVLASTNKMIKKRGAQTVLWGCSIESDILDSDVITDLKRYDLITPRESITYNALLEKGVNKNTYLFPDPAFILDKIELPLPDGFIENNTVGLNISPLIIGLEKANNITYKNYSNLIEYIIDNTDMQIALIPHVTWEHNNDLEPLTALYDQYKHTGRVVLFGDQYNCMELKGFISRCRMFVGARTHATIAAYSTGVPTLVVGYSVKARGIARDIFGSEENKVIPVQSFENEDDLVNAFIYIQENEEAIRKHLQDFMPSYIEKAWLAGEEVKKLIKK
ncbi:MAG: polysaccharide pyruvyl transferase family protein [Clostridiales bacterium]|nr:polysaccharide pyruvyl transferase family protein [Clostridiales bacterium]